MKILLVGLLGYIGVLFRDMPKKIFELILTNISSSITVTSQNKEQYKKMNIYLAGLNKKSIINNCESGNSTKHGRVDEVISVNYGTYLFKLDKLTYGYLTNVLKDTTYDVSSVITLKIFGKKRETVLREIKENLKKSTTNGIRTFCSTDYWDSGKIVQRRNFNQIYLKQKDFLISKILEWDKNEKFYEERGIIHKLGIMLYGEPGCGKSSIAKAIASTMDYDIYYINLKGYKDYKSLVDKLNSIPERSLVLLEDIDCIIKNRESKDNNNVYDEILNTSLNFLDGVLSPNHCIIVATTNYIDRLDNAFTREGRFDVKIETTKLDKDLAIKMCSDYGVEFDDLDIDIPINPSKLQNKLFQVVQENGFKRKENC